MLVEQRSQTDPTVQLLRQVDNSDDLPSEIVLSDLLWAIKSAKDDDRIKALVIKPQGLQGTSFSKLQEVASAIDAFKESGKPVIAMADFYTQGQYLLAAHADHVLLNQSGAVVIEGLGVYQTYYKSALEKLNITPTCSRSAPTNPSSNPTPVTRCPREQGSEPALAGSAVAILCGRRGRAAEIEPDAVAPGRIASSSCCARPAATPPTTPSTTVWWTSWRPATR